MSNVSSIGITPGFQEISLQPGEIYQGTFGVVNSSSDESDVVEYKVFVAPFSVSGEDYSVNFDTVSDFTKITNWITIEQPTGSVKGKEVVEVPYTISVPENAPGGGQYASFIVRITNPNDGSSEEYSISVNYQAASILYASLEGDIHQEGEIIKNNINGFFFDSPIIGQASVKNSGNVHFDVSSYIQVFPLFSSEEVFSSEESPKNNIALPETTLSTFNSWDDTPQLGVFRVVQTVSYLGNISKSEKTVFVCPPWFLGLWLIFIFGLISWATARARARKKAVKHANEFSGKSSH